MRRSGDHPIARRRARAFTAVIAGTVLVATGVGAVAAQAGTSNITISDDSLAACIAADLGADPGNTFTVDQLAEVVVLHCDGNDDSGAVASLSGASALSGLTELSLSGSAVTDLSPLAGLANLTSLSVQSSRLSSVSALSSLSGLRSLSLDSAMLTDVSALSGLTSLTTLGLTAPLTSLRSLSGLTHLTTLGVVSAKLTDLSPLASLTSLQSLQLTVPAASDLVPLSGLTKLGQLRVDSGAASLSPLAGLTGLTALQVSSATLSSIAPLAGLSRLGTLSVTDSPVSDVSPLSHLTGLTELHLDRDLVADVSPLAGLSGLSVLSLDGDQITDPSPIARLTGLSSLSLTDNQLSDVSALKALVDYYWLDLSGNQISDLSPLKVASGKEIYRRLKADDQVVALPLEAGSVVTLPLKGLDGSAPSLTPDSGVTVSGGVVSVSGSDSYSIDFTAGSLETDGYSFSGVVTIGNCMLVAATPAINGDAVVGETLTAVPGRWGPAPVSLSYQWLADGAAISDATSSVYAISSSDRGKHLSVTVTGGKTGYPDLSVTSAATDAVGSQAVSPAPVPNLTGTALVGGMLTVQTNTWATGASIAIQWLRDGSPISGATGTTYQVQASDVGYTLSVRVTGSLDGYVSVVRTSESTSVVPATSAFSKAATPTISGTTAVGRTVTAKVGTWSPTPSGYSYQWLRAGIEISGATAATYLLGPADAGTFVSVRVTAIRAGVSSAIRTSKGSKVSAGTLSTVTPHIDNTRPVVDTTLTADPGAWSPSTVAFGYQWYKVTSKGKRYTIAGATKATLTVDGSLAGYRLQVKVTGSQTGYRSAYRYSARTATVAKARLASQGGSTVLVDGTPRVGKVLTAVPATYLPSASYSYRWYRGSHSISKATKSTYVLTSSDRGRTIKVKVTARRTGYYSVSTYAVLDGSVQAGLAALTPKLSDTTPAVGQVISVTAATSVDRWSPVPTTVGYRWLRDGKAIDGATGVSYAVQAADKGKRLTVEVTGGAADYSDVVRVSARSSRVA